jgi:hypothetical protein
MNMLSVAPFRSRAALLLCLAAYRFDYFSRGEAYGRFRRVSAACELRAARPAFPKRESDALYALFPALGASVGRPLRGSGFLDAFPDFLSVMRTHFVSPSLEKSF